jgi:hypothetical protein
MSGSEKKLLDNLLAFALACGRMWRNRKEVRQMRVLLILLLTGVAALAQNGGSRYNPYRGFYGGWDFDNGGSASYNPYTGFNGGYDITNPNGSNGGHYKWNPYKGFNGGWDYSPY